MNTCDDMVSDTPTSKGPSVMMAQYTRMRLAQPRSARTRQMRLKTFSIMPIMAADVTSSATAPTADNRVALDANWVR